MKFRHLFVLATAPPLIAGLLPAAFAAEENYASLKPVMAQKAPAGLDGALAAHKGKPVLVNFWATWCPPCREEMPALGRLAQRWQAKGLVVHTVAVADKAKDVEDFLWEISTELTVQHDRDQSISRAWGARMLPTTVVLDRRHRVVLRGTGAIDWDAPAVDKQMQSLLN